MEMWDLVGFIVDAILFLILLRMVHRLDAKLSGTTKPTKKEIAFYKERAMKITGKDEP